MQCYESYQAVDDMNIKQILIEGGRLNKKCIWINHSCDMRNIWIEHRYFDNAKQYTTDSLMREMISVGDDMRVIYEDRWKMISSICNDAIKVVDIVQ